MEKVRKKLPRSSIKTEDASPVSFLWSGCLLFPETLNLGAVTYSRLGIYALLSVSSEMDGNWDHFQQQAPSDHALGVPISCYPEAEERPRAAI